MLRILPKPWGLAIPILSFSIREDFSHTEAQRSQSGLFSVPLRFREIQFLSHLVNREPRAVARWLHDLVRILYIPRPHRDCISPKAGTSGQSLTQYQSL